MKVYIVVKDSTFPYFLTYQAEDTGEHYKVCAGLAFRYDKVKRFTKKEWDILCQARNELVDRKERSDSEFRKRAKELVGNW